MGSIYTDYCFSLSADIDLSLKIYVSHVDCALSDSLGIRPEDVFVSARIIDGGAGLHACVRATRSPIRSGNRMYWNEWLTFPVKIRDLPRTAQLVVMLVGPSFSTLAGSTLRCFDERSVLKRGLQHVTMWPSGEYAQDAADRDPDAQLPLVVSDGAFEHLKRLEAFQLGELQASPWTDRLAFSQLRRELRDQQGYDVSRVGHGPSQLVLQFPAFDFPVIYEELSYHDAVAAATSGSIANMIPVVAAPPIAVTNSAAAALVPSLGYTPIWYENQTLCVVADPEADVTDNPCEAMNQWLARGRLRSTVNPDLKPNVMESAAIQAAISAPIRTSPDLSTKNLLWQFRYSLTGNKKALVKFVMVRSSKSPNSLTATVHVWFVLLERNVGSRR